MTHVLRAYDATIDDVNIEKRSVVARINTSSRDRYNTVIMPRGCQSKNWRAAGGPILWEHGKDTRRGTDPIANGSQLWNNGGPMPTELVAEPVFLKDDFAQQRFEWYRDGVVKGWSVNILPSMKSAGPPTRDELRARPDWEGVETVYREWDLAEFSGTVIPGNAEALTSDRATAIMQAVERGLWLPDEARDAYAAALERPASEGQERYIRKEGGKWCVYSESGKKLGEFDSEEAAKKRLAQIEYFKHEDKDKGRSAPTVEADGEAWVIRGVDGDPLARFDSEPLAVRCLELMQVAPTFETDRVRLQSEFRAWQDRAASEQMALLDLMLNGRV